MDRGNSFNAWNRLFREDRIEGIIYLQSRILLVVSFFEWVSVSDFGGYAGHVGCDSCLVCGEFGVMVIES